MWTAERIRRVFLDFFAARDHRVVPSSGLIPHDPTLLLTNAGMNQFKPYMLGEEPAPYPRAASVQKVFRTTDIEIIGTTMRHLTFFEMLGNFSLGEYFKEQVIPWAWELVTEHFGLDPDRLWVTIYESDDEAAAIWLDAVGLRAERLVRLGQADNFWDMGVAGPCGPNSEIFFDKGPAYGEEGGPAVDEERYVEFWNLVFMEFECDRPKPDLNIVRDLPRKCIDTGSGLERCLVVLNGLDSVFEVDTLREVLARAESLSGVKYGADPETDVSLRVLADHGRAVTFLIGDGVFPSNEGRGYVLRRVLRRAVRHAHLIGVERSVIPELADAVIEIMGGLYPDLARQRDFIIDVGGREEERFRQTLRQGTSLLEAELDRIGRGGALSGEVAFRLHDTFGFPVDLTREMAAEAGVDVDDDGFRVAMEGQRERARASRKAAGDATGPTEVYRDVLAEFGTSRFTGYHGTSGDARALVILTVEGDRVDAVGEGELVDLFVDETPFYAEAGGQISDTGRATADAGRAVVLDTQYAVPGLIRHRVKVTSGRLIAGERLRLEVDHGRRESVRRNHTATHLLHWALRDVLGDHVKQHGSLVAPDRLRFDFSHYSAVTGDELAEVERRANSRVLLNEPVHWFETSKDHAEELGAIAFFGDKYGDVVRVVDAGACSRELCGGTHVDMLGMIGPIAVVSEASIGANMRRVEALTGDAALELLRSRARLLQRTAEMLKTAAEDVPERVGRLVEEQQALRKELAAAARTVVLGQAEELAATAEAVGEHRLVVARRDGLDTNALKDLAVGVRDRLASGVVVVGGTPDGEKAALAAAVSKNLVTTITAADVLTDAAKAVGGGASKTLDVAQAGGRDVSAIDRALETARAAARTGLT